MMDALPGGAKSAFTEMLERVLPEFMKDRIKTCVPGSILSFDPTTQLAVVQVGLKLQRASDGSYHDPAPVMEVPVQFPGGQAGTLEFKITPGAEGMIFFSQEAADSWIVQGGVVVRSDDRRFSPDDAFFAPGFRSMAGALSSFQNNGIRLRNAAGTSYVWIKDDGTVEIDGAMLNVKCPATFDDDVMTMAQIFNMGVYIGSLHTHQGVESGPDTSGPVTP